MELQLPDDLMHGFAEDELKLELACFLHAQAKATAEEAAEIAGLPVADFLQIRAERPYAFEQEEHGCL